jgi:hypothetical protein
METGKGPTEHAGRLGRPERHIRGLSTPLDGAALCVNCNRPRDAHRLANYADGPHIGEAFLVCPTNVFADPIASAVRAELQPLEDALIDAGHKLAKDGAR